MIFAFAPVFCPVQASLVTARFEVELAERDDPSFWRVERSGERLTFTHGSQTFGATRTGKTGFRMDANEQLDEATGDLDEHGNGVIRFKDRTVALRGRRVAAFSEFALTPRVGEGLQELNLAKRMLEAKTTGLAVALRRPNGSVEYGLYGEVRAGDGRITESTTFQVGTMGTPVLHLGALRLIQAGKLRLGQAVNTVLGKETIPNGPNGWGDRVTVRDLLRGTSGFAFDKSRGYAPGEPVEDIAISAPIREPGGQEGVSRLNEYLLERVIAKAGGATASEVIRREVFRPLGLRDSRVGSAPKGSARGHYSTGEPTLRPYHRYTDAFGNGLWTSLRDFSRILEESNTILDGRKGKLGLEPSLVARVVGPNTLLGIRRDARDFCYLGGDSYGFFCEFFSRPKTGESVLVLQNRMMGWRLVNDIRDAIWSKQN